MVEFLLILRFYAFDWDQQEDEEDNQVFMTRKIKMPHVPRVGESISICDNIMDVEAVLHVLEREVTEVWCDCDEDTAYFLFHNSDGEWEVECDNEKVQEKISQQFKVVG